MPETEKGINTAGLREQLSLTGINHLLVIAIDTYEHCPPLRNCVDDAEQLIDVLTKNYRFDPEH
jgi:hypothetical protein